MRRPVDLAPGTVFAGDFRVQEPLGEGGFGAVYAAEQLSTGARRALKLMHPELVQDPRMRERFEQEAQVSARIASDHVVHVIASGVDAGTGSPFIAMELLSGSDLAKYVSERGSVAPDVAAEVLRQLCHGLGAAHALGVVHRDLKPENVYLADPRRAGVPFTVKILDFGIAKVVAEAAARTTAAIGTPLWSAPEQMDTVARVSPATDIWPLGLLGFWLLTGRYFWCAANAEDLSVQAILRESLVGPIPLPAARARELHLDVAIPGWFDAWFDRCVQRDPAERFADGRLAGEALESHLRQSAGLDASRTVAPATDVDRGAPGAFVYQKAAPGQVALPTALVPVPPLALPELAPPAKRAPSLVPLLGCIGALAVAVAGIGLTAAYQLGSSTSEGKASDDKCPRGAHREGDRCVADISEECEEGFRFKKGRGCVAVRAEDEDDDRTPRSPTETPSATPSSTASPISSPTSDPVFGVPTSTPTATPTPTPAPTAKPVPKPNSTSAGSSSGQCGCAPGDLMCNMQCSAKGK